MEVVTTELHTSSSSKRQDEEEHRHPYIYLYQLQQEMLPFPAVAVFVKTLSFSVLNLLLHILPIVPPFLAPLLICLAILTFSVLLFLQPDYYRYTV